MEEYVTLSLCKYLVFKYSLMLLRSGLAIRPKKLLKTGLDRFKQLFKKIYTHEVQKCRLVVRKGVYSYEYMDSRVKMDEEQHPPNEAFSSK